MFSFFLLNYLIFIMQIIVKPNQLWQNKKAISVKIAYAFKINLFLIRLIIVIFLKELHKLNNTADYDI